MTAAFNLSQFANNVNTSGKASLTSAVTGTLPIANGGTGSSSTAYCSLTSNVTGTLPIANGGTGATTAAGALSNLGALQGTAAQLAKAWVKYNGVTQTVLASYNVSSVTYSSSGRYTVNFASALADSNYAYAISASNNSGWMGVATQNIDFPPTASGIAIVCNNNAGGGTDTPGVCVTCFR